MAGAQDAQPLRLRSIFRRAGALLLILFGTYLAAAALGGHVAANPGWREPPEGITIYVESNGVHTGIVMPTVAAGLDWRARLGAEALHPAGRWLAFGWGDLAFYRETPQWTDLQLSTAISALTGTGTAALHVAHYDAVYPDREMRPIRLRPEEYRRLAAVIDATFVAAGAAMPGYGVRDRFHPAHGHYSAIRTCNAWVGNALRHAGVRTGIWTPFAEDVMRWMPVRQPHR